MRRRHDDRHPARDVLEHRAHHGFALGVGDHKLFGEIGEDADALRAGIDHEIDAAALAIEVEIAAVIKDGRYDRKDAAIGTIGGHAVSGRLSALVVDVDADGPQQHQALDHLLVVDANTKNGHAVVHYTHDHGADHGATDPP